MIVINFLSKSKHFPVLNPISITLKSTKLQHNSFLQQKSVKFGTDLTQGRKKLTQALLACSFVFQSLLWPSIIVAQYYCGQYYCDQVMLLPSIFVAQYYCYPVLLRPVLLLPSFIEASIIVIQYYCYPVLLLPSIFVA